MSDEKGKLKAHSEAVHVVGPIKAEPQKTFRKSLYAKHQPDTGQFWLMQNEFVRGTVLLPCWYIYVLLPFSSSLPNRKSTGEASS